MAQTDTASGAPRRRGSAVLRGFGFALAIALGAVAIWLIATSDTVKTQRIGALAGMWGVLVGAYSVFGSRRHDAPAEPGSALELRQNAALARSEDVASQREFQARLEALLRREVQEGVSRELAGLRSEVSSLRSEILEKVGGQLRMERTETTRLFGSNLEALQREVRQLKVRQLGDTGTIDAIDAIDVPSYPASTSRQHTVDAEEIVDAAPAGRPPASTLPPSAVPPVPQQPGSAFPPFRPLEPMRAFGPRADLPTDSAAAEPPAERAAVVEPAYSGPLPSFAPLNFTPATPAPTPTPMFSDPLPVPAPVVPVLAPIVAPAAATLEPTPVPTPAVPPTPAFVPAPSATVPSMPPVPAMPPILPMPPVLPTASPSSPALSEPLPAPPAFPAFPATPEPAPGPVSDDPFASMPRIRPFTDFELDDVERPAAPPEWPAPQWRAEPISAASASRLSGRHATAAASVPESSGGRRRRTDDSENDVLARVLERENGPSSGEDDY